MGGLVEFILILLLVGLPIVNLGLIVYNLFKRNIGFQHFIIIVGSAIMVPVIMYNLFPSTGFGRIGISFLTLISIFASFFIVNVIAFFFLTNRLRSGRPSSRDTILDDGVATEH